MRKVRAIRCRWYGGFEEALLVAGVVALADVAVAVDLFVLEQGLDGVGELEFAAGAGGDGFDHLEDARREDVAADDGVLRGLRAGRGFSTMFFTASRRGLVGSGVQSRQP
jgi:hypothetical protein